MELSGKHVLITGASSGIGLALAHVLLDKGVTLTSMDRTHQRPQEQRDRWISLDVDVTNEKSVRSAFSHTSIPIDILINNAGVMRRGSVFESTEEDFDLLFDVHMKGSWLVLKYALPFLYQRAQIVQMCSRHALGLPSNPALYGLSKRCAMDLAELVAKTYPNFAVKILCPGPVNTPLARHDVTKEELEDKKRIMCTPEDLAVKIVELLESEKKTRLFFDARTSTHFLE